MNPTVLVEVLSPSTEQYDRTETLAHYQRIDSLREVVLIAQAERHIEVWRRSKSGEWEKNGYRSGAAVLTSVDVTLPFDDVYRDPLASWASASHTRVALTRNSNTNRWHCPT